MEEVVQSVYNNYTVWRKDRRSKGGEGGMIMTRKELLVKSVVYEERKAEIHSVLIGNKNRNDDNNSNLCTPPRTNSWNREKYEVMIENTIQNLSRLLKANKRVLLVGDVNCNKGNWETFESGGRETAWGRFIRPTMENDSVGEGYKIQE